MTSKTTVFVAVPAFGILAAFATLYKLLKSDTRAVFQSKRDLPCYIYLYVRYKIQTFRKRRGHLSLHKKETGGPTLSVLHCRLRESDVRWFCLTTGYGWDYPDSVFRDIPLGFCDVLCCRLLAMLMSSDDFALSPQGLRPVRQILRKKEAIDELKKSLFRLDAGVSEYRCVDTGVEVDIWFKASRAGGPIWECVLTMLSPRDLSGSSCLPQTQDGHGAAAEVISSVIKVPLFTGLKSAWSLSDISFKNMLVLPTRVGIVGRSMVYGPWMVSRCLAEIEKHKGSEAVRAPLCVSVQFRHPLALPRQLTLWFWEAPDESCAQPKTVCRFQLWESTSGTIYTCGEITREQQ